jgi:tetratricopeptide (TPR) repeat protein
MWLENTITLLKTKRLSLSSRISSALALLICVTIWQGQSSATAEIDQLDPALILFHQEQTENVQGAENSTGWDDAIDVPDTEPKVCEPPKMLPRCFSPDARFLLFETTDSQTSFQQEHAEPMQPVPDRLQETDQTRYAASEKLRPTPKDELLKASISSVTADSNSPNKQTLNRLIEQISSMKIRPKPKEPQPETQPQRESKELVSDANETKPTKPELTQAQEDRQQSTRTLNPEIVQRIERIIEKSGKTDDPQLLADMLYQTGYYELAAYFYELAITRDDNTQADDTDNAWLMMQKAVCLSSSNPQQALQTYKSLISQYPASPWTELARNRQDLTDWLEAQQPEKLIEKCRQDLQAN